MSKQQQLELLETLVRNVKYIDTSILQNYECYVDVHIDSVTYEKSISCCYLGNLWVVKYDLEDDYIFKGEYDNEVYDVLVEDTDFESSALLDALMLSHVYYSTNIDYNFPTQKLDIFFRLGNVDHILFQIIIRLNDYQHFSYQKILNYLLEMFTQIKIEIERIYDES